MENETEIQRRAEVKNKDEEKSSRENHLDEVLADRLRKKGKKGKKKMGEEEGRRRGKKKREEGGGSRDSWLAYRTGYSWMGGRFEGVWGGVDYV